MATAKEKRSLKRVNADWRGGKGLTVNLRNALTDQWDEVIRWVSHPATLKAEGA